MDLRLRERERSGAAGAPGWVRARLRAGELAPERVLLAGYLGHGGAALALSPPPAPSGVEAWLRALRADANARRILGALAAAEGQRLWRPYLEAALADELERELGGWHGSSTSLDRALLRLVPEGLVEELQGGALLRLTPVGALWLGANLAVGSREASSRAWHALLRDALPRWEARDPGNWRYRKSVETLEDYVLEPTLARREGWSFWVERSVPPSEALRETLREQGEDYLRGLIARDVAGWALGLCDPVREGSAAREQAE